MLPTNGEMFNSIQRCPYKYGEVGDDAKELGVRN